MDFSNFWWQAAGAGPGWHRQQPAVLEVLSTYLGLHLAMATVSGLSVLG